MTVTIWPFRRLNTMSEISIQSMSIQLSSFMLESGEASGQVAVDCCLWGPSDKPLVVVMGGISANRWAFSCPSNQQTGWWSQVVNDAATLNSKEFQFLTFDYFSFPNNVINPPLLTTTDQAQLLKLLQKQLKLPQLYAVIGASYGGMVALAFAAAYPGSLQHLICLAAADKNSVKSQALRHIQRNVIGLGQQFATDPNSQKQFMSLARSLAMVGYRGEDEWEHRFQHEQPGKGLDEVTAYLQYHGNKFADKFSASRYCQLSRSIDYHQVDVSAIEADTLLIGFSSDQMVPVHFIENMIDKFRSPCQAKFINSIYGHDGFLLEAEQINAIFKNYFREKAHDCIEPNSCCASGY